MAVYRIADVNMRICPNSRFTRDLLKDYAVGDGKVQLEVPSFADSDSVAATNKNKIFFIVVLY